MNAIATIQREERQRRAEVAAAVARRKEIVEFYLRRIAVEASSAKPPLSDLDILDIVAAELRVSVEWLLEPSHGRDRAWPRQVAAYLIKQHCGATNDRVGRAIGLSRKTVAAGIAAAEDRIQSGDPKTVKLFVAAEAKIVERKGQCCA